MICHHQIIIYVGACAVLQFISRSHCSLQIVPFTTKIKEFKKKCQFVWGLMPDFNSFLGSILAVCPSFRHSSCPTGNNQFLCKWQTASSEVRDTWPSGTMSELKLSWRSFASPNRVPSQQPLDWQSDVLSTEQARPDLSNVSLTFFLHYPTRRMRSV